MLSVKSADKGWTEVGTANVLSHLMARQHG